MKRLMLAVGAIVLLGAGTWVCTKINWDVAYRNATGGNRPRVGTSYKLSSSMPLYFKPETFQEAVTRHDAGARDNYEDWERSHERGEQIPLGIGTVLKVAELTSGGAKVAVMNKDERGKIGWVLDDTLMIFAEPKTP